MTKALRVVIIEDDSWFAEQQARTLVAAGFIVQHVSNGLAGIEAIDDFRPDVVVLDVFLPGPNALALLHEIQSHTDLAQIPVIICTNATSSLSPEWLLPYGVRSVIDKTTMTPDSFVAAVRKVLL